MSILDIDHRYLYARHAPLPKLQTRKLTSAGWSQWEDVRIVREDMPAEPEPVVAAPAKADKPIPIQSRIYVNTEDGDGGRHVTVSSFPSEHDDWEKNVFYIHVPSSRSLEASKSVVMNVLRNGGGHVIDE